MEATTTLADALLDDLDDLSDNEEEEETENVVGDATDPALTSDFDGNELSYSKESPRLVDDDNFLKHVEKIRSVMGEDIQNSFPMSESSMILSTPPATCKDGALDHHQLMVLSNQFLALISTELMNSHHQLCDVYKYKFPELEELIPDVVQYMQVVRCIGNATDITTKTINDALNMYLSNQQIITLSVAYSTTNGRLLSESELAQVHTIALYMEQVLSIRDLLLKYIEQQMESTVPNMYALVGPTISAQLLSITGGLAALSKIPSCNLQVLGQSKHRRAGLITNHLQQPNHTGVLAQTDLVQSCPRHLHMKVVKMVAAKLALAIRCDYIQTDVAGKAQKSDASGRLFRQEIEKKIQQLQEPDKAPVLKALPKPDLTVKKRRGGQRMRRLKGRYEETALMKQANTRAFSVQTGEYGDDAMGRTLGLLEMSTGSVGNGASGTGAIRRNTAEKRKMKYANTRASRKMAAQANMKGLSSSHASLLNNSASGLASSMAFTPVQGMELVNPDAAKDRVREANRKWFHDNAGFQSALPKK